MPLVDAGVKQVDRLGKMTEDLDAHMTRVTDRVEIVEIIEDRLDSLDAIASDVDSKLAEQLARRVELETLKAQCDGVTTQMLDIQQKIGSVAARQGKILRMENRLTILQDRLQNTGKQIKEVQRDEAVLAEQEARLTGLAEASRSLAAEATERLERAEALTEQIARSTATKGELIEELARVQARQRDAVAHVDVVEDQLRRTETMYVALQQRRSQLAFSEKKLTMVEEKMSKLTQTSADVEEQMKALVERGSMIAAARAEVESIHQISTTSREDLQYINDQRGGGRRVAPPH